MEPFVKTEQVTLKQAEDEVAPVLVHLKELLRIKNRLCSPLLRLPTEIIIRILSYTMENMGRQAVWQPIISTCHHIHWIMCTVTELWWKVDCTWTEEARIAFARSKGNPQAIVVELDPQDYNYQNHRVRKALDHWRDTQALHGHRLRTLELSGVPSDMDHFSWIFEQPLPRLHHLKIHFLGPLYDAMDGLALPVSEPVALQLPTDLAPRVLDLSNATLPWSSSLLAGLSGLHISFWDCDADVEISPDELLGILDASPRLESLSLVRVTIPFASHNGGEPRYAPTRIAQLPSLTSLKLDHFSEFVGSALAHMNTPAITSLEIRSRVLPTEVSSSLRRFFPDRRFPDRLFQNPPVFRIGSTIDDGFSPSIDATIGGIKMEFEFDFDAEEAVRSAIASCILPLVPPSVANLDLCGVKLNEDEWRVFFRLHPEARSLKISESSMEPGVPESLWGALSPAGMGEAPLCPKLDSIASFASTALLNCLRNRKSAGFGLRHLEFGSLGRELVQEFGPLVEVLNVPGETETVCPVSTNELGLARLSRLTARIPM